MSKQEVTDKIKALLSKAPKPERIASVQTARRFKSAADAAIKAKSQAKAEEALRQLEVYYQ